MTLLMKIPNAPFVLALMLAQLVSAQDDWMPANGRSVDHVLALMVNAKGHVFAGTNAGGVLRSTDYGATWAGVSQGLPSGAVFALAQDTKGRMLAGIQGSFNQDGVYFSRDEGCSWKQIIGENEEFKNSVRCFAFTPSGAIVVGTYGGTFRTDDLGKFWAQTTFENQFVEAVASTAQGLVFAGTRQSIFVSRDEGKTWEPHNAGLPNGGGAYLFYADDNGDLFAASYRHGLVRLLRNGMAWQPLNTGLLQYDVNALTGDGRNTLFVALRDLGIFRSQDYGENWTPTSNEFTSLQIRAMAAQRGGRVYASVNYGNLFRSNDNGQTWESITPGALYYSTTSALLAEEGGAMLAGADAGVFRTRDHGRTWTQLLGSPTQPIFILALARDTLTDELWAASFLQGIFRSQDSGKSWQSRNNGLHGPGIDMIVIDARHGYVYALAKAYGIFFSSDRGTSWSLRNNGLLSIGLSALALAPDGSVLVGTYINEIYRSQNHGESWTQIKVTESGRGIIHAFFVDAEATIFAGTDNGILRSTDNGESWQPLRNDLEGIAVRSFAKSRAGQFFVGTEYHGVLRSLDNGATWVSFNRGRSGSRVHALAFDRNEYLFVGTQGAGVFRTVLPMVSFSENNPNPANVFALGQNFPNPFNFSTTIAFTLSAGLDVTLQVYDAVGREVATLRREFLQPGAYSISWCGEGMASGVYYYRLQAGKQVQTKKLLFIK